jgi:hypothetical protein
MSMATAVVTLIAGHRESEGCRKKAYIFVTRRIPETLALFCSQLEKESRVTLRNVTKDALRGLGKYPHSFWSYDGLLVFEVTSW